ncbi:MAG: DNA repair protein RecN [Bdellovibrionota bacterium]
MLRELSLTNLAVIERATIEFDEGLTVLTGETGAGKSLLAGAMNLLLGTRASADLIRTGTEEAAVEAAFEGGDTPQVRKILEDAGIPVESTLIVRRTLSRSGKNRIHINGSLAPLGVLSAVGEKLLGILGQHEHHDLLEEGVQRDLLDQYAGHHSLVTEMEKAFGALREAKEALEALSSDEAERAKRIDYLKFLCEELSAAALVPGEEEKLLSERSRLASAEKIAQAAQQGMDVLYESEGAVSERLGKLSAQLAPLEALDGDLSSAAKLLREAAPLIQEAAASLRHATGKFGDDAGSIEARLNEIEGRLDLLTKLKRKHGEESAEKLTEKLESLSKELEALQHYDSELASRREAVQKAERAATKTAQALTKSREKAAGKLSKDAGEELVDLGLPKTALQVKLSPLDTLQSHGADRIEYLFSPNPGEAPRPLSKIASGGELSRVLLALRLVLTEPGRVRTLVLDEVDAGIGGITAESVGKKIRRLSKSFQVLCISHLPQIACQADRHLYVAKQEKAGRTLATVRALSSDERIEELSRMLGGSLAAGKARATAQELIAQASRAG